MNRMPFLLLGGAAAIASCAVPSAHPTGTATVQASAPAKVQATSMPAIASAAARAAAATATNPYLGGVAMLGTRTIAQNCSAAPNLRTVARALGSYPVRAIVSRTAPVTMFAPTDAAFARLRPDAVERLMADGNRATLAQVMDYHVVPGAITLDQLRVRIGNAGGSAQLDTVNGAKLTATLEGPAVALTDVNGNKSYIETPDIQQSDGIIHVVNGVLVPRLG